MKTNSIAGCSVGFGAMRAFETDASVNLAPKGSEEPQIDKNPLVGHDTGSLSEPPGGKGSEQPQRNKTVYRGSGR